RGAIEQREADRVQDGALPCARRASDREDPSLREGAGLELELELGEAREVHSSDRAQLHSAVPSGSSSAARANARASSFPGADGPPLVSTVSSARSSSRSTSSRRPKKRSISAFGAGVPRDAR